MTTSGSRICFGVSFGLLLLSGFVLTVPGSYWIIYLLVAALASVTVYHGPRWYRICAAVIILLTVVLTIMDLHAGRRYRAQRIQRQEKMRTLHKAHEGEVMDANLPSAPQPPTNATH